MSLTYIRNIERSTIEAMERFNGPGICANLVVNGEIAYKMSFGVSELGNAAPVTSDTIFSIMSIAKSFTATAIMQLVEAMCISLDDPVSSYLPYFHVRDEKYIKSPITVKQVLSHTAGFPEYFPIASLQDENLKKMYREIPQYQAIMSNFPDEVLKRIKNREDVTRSFADVNLLYKPGEGWQYCTDAYVIAGDLLEKVTGMTWEEYIHENIINRLNLDRTFTDPAQLTQKGDRTHYYTLIGSSLEEVPTPINPICAPSGFIYSSVNDLTKYLLSHMDFLQSPLLNGNSLMNMQKMIAKRKENLSYGLGWKIRKYRDVKIVEHGGGYPGVSAYATMIPSMGFGFVIFSNNDKVPVMQISEYVTDQFLDVCSLN